MSHSVAARYLPMKVENPIKSNSLLINGDRC
jgi:hypothetical protein